MSARRAELKRCFFFHCQCARCELELKEGPGTGGSGGAGAFKASWAGSTARGGPPTPHHPRDNAKTKGGLRKGGGLNNRKGRGKTSKKGE